MIFFLLFFHSFSLLSLSLSDFSTFIKTHTFFHVFFLPVIWLTFLGFWQLKDDDIFPPIFPFLFFAVSVLEWFFNYLFHSSFFITVHYIDLPMFVPPVYPPGAYLSFSHIPLFVSVIPIHLLIQPSFVYLILVILVSNEAYLCILYTYPQCNYPLILLFLLDLYKCCKTMKHSQFHGLIESCNLHQRCVCIYYKTSLHICHSTQF